MGVSFPPGSYSRPVGSSVGVALYSDRRNQRPQTRRVDHSIQTFSRAPLTGDARPPAGELALQNELALRGSIVADPNGARPPVAVEVFEPQARQVRQPDPLEKDRAGNQRAVQLGRLYLDFDFRVVDTTQLS